MKDAVVLFNGGCTGELISPEGLLVTTTTAVTAPYRAIRPSNTTT